MKEVKVKDTYAGGMVFFTLLSIAIIILIINIDFISKRKWEKEIKNHSINSIALVFNSEVIFYKNGYTERFWKKVKRVYVNRETIQPPKLYKKADFIYIHCNQNYSLLTNKDIDSIVYKFPPIDIYEEFVKGKLINKSKEFYSKRKYHKKYSKVLPKCDE